MPNPFSIKQREVLQRIAGPTEPKPSDPSRSDPAAIFRAKSRRAGLPSRHCGSLASMTWTDQIHQAWLELVSEIDDGGFAALIGPSGTGKTQLATAAMARHFFAQWGGNPPAFYLTANDLFLKLRSAMTGTGLSEDVLFSVYKHCDFLILDEFGELSGTDYETRRLVDLIDFRYRNKLPMILVGNGSRETFSRRMGPSAVSRCHEVCVIIETHTWSNFRVGRRESRLIGGSV